MQLKNILKMTEPRLRVYLEKQLKYYYKNVVCRHDFMIAFGSIPVALIAHMDTVWGESKDKLVFHDKDYDVMWSLDGLGADDRAGIYAILKILEAGYRPTVIFTSGEEVGGVGAYALARAYPSCPPVSLKYIIELDRQGSKDCVFYNCVNSEFKDFIENFNFVTQKGTFTDISIICPIWNIAGVNLSVGYYNEHTTNEILVVKILENTIGKVKAMLDCVENTPYYIYRAATPPHGSGLFCDLCKAPIEDEVYSLVVNNKRVCLNCLDNCVDWCDRCGEPYFVGEDHECGGGEYDF